MHALPAEISGVAGHDSQVVDQGNGGNLLVDGGGNQETDPNMKSRTQAFLQNLIKALSFVISRQPYFSLL
mgnify:CR=1 FL=1